MVVSHGQLSFGEVAVHLFFFISGFLITASWLNSRSMDDYLRRRVLRIYPGYTVALVASFLVALAFAGGPLSDVASHLEDFPWDVCYLSFSSCSGDWVFPHNPFPHTANGSLWTISFEFICYLIVAAIGLFGLFKRRAWMLVFFVAMFAWCARVVLLRGPEPVHSELSFVHARFLMTFLAGASAWLWRDKIPIHTTFALLALLLIIGTIPFSPWFSMLLPVAGGYVVLWLGYHRPLKSLMWCNKTDLSYGTYLYAFPIQQMLVVAGLHLPYLLFAAAAPATLAVALVSWTFVEKPFLRMKSRNFSDNDPGAMAPSVH